MAKLLQVKIKWFRIEKIDPFAELVLPHISFCRVPGGKALNDPLESNEKKCGAFSNAGTEQKKVVKSPRLMCLPKEIIGLQIVKTRKETNYSLFRQARTKIQYTHSINRPIYLQFTSKTHKKKLEEA